MRSIALVALMPLAAFAQTSIPEPAAPAAAAAASRPASWSLGAGVGFQPTPLFTQSSTAFISSSLSGVYLSAPAAPFAGASLERRLSAWGWFILGVDGSYGQDRQDLAPDQAGVTKSDLYRLAVSAGIRHFVTPAGAPVGVSVDLLASGGASRWKGDADYYDYAAGGAIAHASFDASARRAGATVGLAIDRELTGALSLRLATPIAGVWYSRTTTKISGRPTLDGEDLGAGLALAPRLELRLAF